MRLGIALLLAAVAAGLCADGARANGDPASDVLPFTTVFLSIKNPNTSPAGRALLAETKATAKKKLPIRVAVISQPSDLGLIQSLWQKPQSYAEFLGKELFQFAHYTGTTLIAMPNGYGVYGPDAAKGRPALARLPKPNTNDLERLGEDAALAVRKVAAANGYVLPVPSEGGSGTSGWVIILAALGGAAVVAGTLFVALRRWLLQP
ncbi:MAG: hypothetical protein E6F94_12260 [Actinobacteria bacterium]|nr:MAG: hypothetical protein E6G38_09455 [Actinomycetota bacterium]TMM23005.1 MAG: hypothetical protein E6F94_12260 [Actinomycetota bacterium]